MASWIVSQAAAAQEAETSRISATDPRVGHIVRLLEGVGMSRPVFKSASVSGSSIFLEGFRAYGPHNLSTRAAFLEVVNLDRGQNEIAASSLVLKDAVLGSWDPNGYALEAKSISVVRPNATTSTIRPRLRFDRIRFSDAILRDGGRTLARFETAAVEAAAWFVGREIPRSLRLSLQGNLVWSGGSQKPADPGRSLKANGAYFIDEHGNGDLSISANVVDGGDYEISARFSGLNRPLFTSLREFEEATRDVTKSPSETYRSHGALEASFYGHLEKVQIVSVSAQMSSMEWLRDEIARRGREVGRRPDAIAKDQAREITSVFRGWGSDAALAHLEAQLSNFFQSPSSIFLRGAHDDPIPFPTSKDERSKLLDRLGLVPTKS